MAFFSSSGLSVPDVSVIIPTFNRISMLQEALSSVYAQEFDGVIEILVVDDNSQDSTSEVVSQNHPEVRLISLKQNVGAYVARNRALLVARGEYIAFLDSDDLWEPNYLNTQISALSKHSHSFSISALVALNITTGEKQILEQRPDLTRFSSPTHQLLVTSSFICSPSSVVFPRTTFDRLGFFDEMFRVGADREFYLRCFLANFQPIFISQPLVTLRKHDRGQLTDSSSQSIKLRKRTRLAYLNKHFHAIEQQPLTVPINRIYAEIYATAAKEFYGRRDLFDWLAETVALAKHSSIKYALINVIRHIVCPMKKFLSPFILQLIRRTFLANSLST